MTYLLVYHPFLQVRMSDFIEKRNTEEHRRGTEKIIEEGEAGEIEEPHPLFFSFVNIEQQHVRDSVSYNSGIPLVIRSGCKSFSASSKH